MLVNKDYLQLETETRETASLSCTACPSIRTRWLQQKNWICEVVFIWKCCRLKLANETAFSLEDEISIHNLHCKAFDNLHAARMHVAQRKFSVYQWTGVVDDNV